MKDTTKILTIKSNKRELVKVERFLNTVFNEYNLPNHCFNKVLLCVNEAVINSIYHGNKNDNEKEVSVEVACIENKLDVKVIDEGYGFNYSSVQDPTIAVNLKKETGRGIHIIKSMSDEIEFKNRGKCVRFKLSVCE